MSVITCVRATQSSAPWPHGVLHRKAPVTAIHASAPPSTAVRGSMRSSTESRNGCDHMRPGFLAP
eukprot:4504951-Pyramimonas_sp.AAC.1